MPARSARMSPRIGSHIMSELARAMLQARRHPLRLVIFDCDGVLVDSERLAVPIDLAMLDDVGIKMTEAEVIERFVGRSTQVMTDAIDAHLGRPLAAEQQTRYERL